jgi:hypothetical protein
MRILKDPRFAPLLTPSAICDALTCSAQFSRFRPERGRKIFNGTTAVNVCYSLDPRDGIHARLNSTKFRRGQCCRLKTGKSAANNHEISVGHNRTRLVLQRWWKRLDQIEKSFAARFDVRAVLDVVRRPETSPRRRSPSC